jgi:hypothetical protein
MTNIVPTKDRKKTGPAPNVLSRTYWNELLTNVEMFPQFCEKALKVVPEGGGTMVPFRLWKIQLWFFKKYILKAYQEGLPIRDIILKARQFGLTTLIEAWAFWSSLSHNNWTSLIIGRERMQGRTIFRMFDRFYTYLPHNQGFPEIYINARSKDNFYFKKPDRRIKLHKEEGKWYLNPDSIIEVTSGEQRDRLGRAGTYTCVHASEVAYWPELFNALTALLQCCHPKPHTAVFLESTANRFNEFHDLWINEEVGGQALGTQWQKIFIPWYLDPRYEVDGKIYNYEKKFYNNEEEILFNRILEDKILNEEIEDIPISIERVWNKLYWRRITLADRCLGSLSKFHQEFPSNDQEAFLFSGFGVWTPEQITWLSSGIKEPKWRGEVLVAAPIEKSEVSETGFSVSQLETKLQPTQNGRLKIWDYPEKFKQYMVSIDVSEGRADETINENDSERDYHAIQVLLVSDFPPLKQVACWHGSCEPHILGLIGVAIASFFNDALLSWEVNGIGKALQFPIVHQSGYRNIYTREEKDTLTGKISQTYGVYVSSGAHGTKSAMIAAGIMFVSEKCLIIQDSATLAEMAIYTDKGNYKYGVSKGHDDRVMSLLQSCYILENRVGELKRRAKILKEKELREDNVEDFKDHGWAWEKDSEGVNKYIGKED